MAPKGRRAKQPSVRCRRVTTRPLGAGSRGRGFDQRGLHASFKYFSIMLRDCRAARTYMWTVPSGRSERLRTIATLHPLIHACRAQSPWPTMFRRNRSHGASATANRTDCRHLSLRWSQRHAPFAFRNHSNWRRHRRAGAALAGYGHDGANARFRAARYRCRRPVTGAAIASAIRSRPDSLRLRH